MKELAQYITNYIDQEIEYKYDAARSWTWDYAEFREWLKEALDAFESTSNTQINFIRKAQ